MRRTALYGHSSGTFVTERLLQPTRMVARKPACRQRRTVRPTIPIRFCSRWGLPCVPRYRRTGALLPHPFTLARWLARSGGFLSVALSLGSPPPGVIWHRVSVEPGLSSPLYIAAHQGGHPAIWWARFTPAMRQGQEKARYILRVGLRLSFCMRTVQRRLE